MGASNAQVSAGNLQQRYDVAYVQCMAASGNKLPTTAEGEPYLFAPYSYSGAYPGYYGYYGYPGYYGPYFGGTVISLGFFGHRHFGNFHHPWGGGWGGFHGGWHGGGGRHR